MQHLSPEDLARLVEEEGLPAESLHLEVCGDCRAELEAMKRQTRALGGLPALSAPPALWGELEERLSAEGLLAGTPAPPRRVRSSPALRIAAALALFLGGAVAGAAAWEARDGSAALAVERAASPEEAAEALREAEDEYLAALARYSELTGAAEAADPVNRLAALEGIVLTARAALQEAPADPVLNGYLLTALGQREAILRRISDTGQEWF
jgi:hypothetical protein